MFIQFFKNILGDSVPQWGSENENLHHILAGVSKGVSAFFNKVMFVVNLH